MKASPLSAASFTTVMRRPSFLWQPRAVQQSRLAASAASLTSARSFSSILDKLGSSVTAHVTKLADEVWLADEKLVTEPRRKIEPQRALQQDLAQRLARQRNVKQRLVPTSIKVDKTRQYVEFTWPEEAVDVMRSLSREAAAATAAAAAANNGTSAVQSAATGFEDSHRDGNADPAAASPQGNGEPARSASSSDNAPPATFSPPLRTRALAEYLRAYTPSTDGALGAKDIVIYGRRGLTIKQIIPMGNYALRFVFSDDHTGGIYSYEYLFYLTGPATKYGLMRAYLRELQRKRKSRNPPKRAPSRRHPSVGAQRAKGGQDQSPTH